MKTVPPGFRPTADVFVVLVSEGSPAGHRAFYSRYFADVIDPSIADGSAPRTFCYNSWFVVGDR